MTSKVPEHLAQAGRLLLNDCPGCDSPVDVSNVQLNEQVLCAECKSLLLLVKIDGVIMFLREGWT